MVVLLGSFPAVFPAEINLPGSLEGRIKTIWVSVTKEAPQIELSRDKLSWPHKGVSSPSPGVSKQQRGLRDSVTRRQHTVAPPPDSLLPRAPPSCLGDSRKIPPFLPRVVVLMGICGKRFYQIKPTHANLFPLLILSGS